MQHRQLAVDCWRLIQALGATRITASGKENIDEAAIKLIEMACDSAAESQRIADGQKPSGVA